MPVEQTNVAAMRKTLEDVRAEFIDMPELVKRIDAALSSPPRNCDRFETWTEAKRAYWVEQGDPCDWRALGAWLFGKAEGGAECGR